LGIKKTVFIFSQPLSANYFVLCKYIQRGWLAKLLIMGKQNQGEGKMLSNAALPSRPKINFHLVLQQNKKVWFDWKCFEITEVKIEIAFG
jgi:hypothetical protein